MSSPPIPNKAVTPPTAGRIDSEAGAADAREATPRRANPPATTGKFTKIFSLKIILLQQT